MSAHDATYLDRIECSVQPLDISFHPQRDNLVAAALVDGTLEVHDIRRNDDNSNDEGDGEIDSIVASLSLHTQLVPETSATATNKGTSESGRGSNKLRPASCRSTSFSLDGRRIYTGGSAGDWCSVDAERACTFSRRPEKQLMWRVDPATQAKNTPLVAIHPFLRGNNSLIATGDDGGGVQVWDERICGDWSQPSKGYNGRRPPGCVLSWNEHDDYISGLEHSADGTTLLATSADCRLGVYDLRMGSGVARAGGKDGHKTFRLSDDQEDELLSLKIMKHGKKVVCGTQEGVLAVFSWGTWGDVSDRFPGHPSSIDALLKLDEDTLLTGSSDGFIRVVQIQPDKLLGVIGDDHGGFPIEKLRFNCNRQIVGSVSHDNYVRLDDARLLQEDGESDEDDEEGGGEEEAKVAVLDGSGDAKKRSTALDGSDDDWDDMDVKAERSEDDDSDDGDSDDGDSDDGDSDVEEEVPTVNDRRKKRLKTENEKFFDDL